MSKNTQISELINYISVDGSGNVVLSSGQLVATQSYVSTAITNLVNSAPSTLDTLNELATALGNDPNFATTIATSIGTKQAQLNGTGFVKITGTTVSYDNSTYALDSVVVKLTGSQTISGVKTFTGAGNTFTQNTNFQDRIYLKSPTTTTYSSLGGDDNKILVGVIGATHEFTFTPNTNYSYVFPAASGTVALTSNLSSYLPLAGGTLTGPLTINYGGGHFTLVRSTFNTFSFGTGIGSGISGLVISDVTAGTNPLIIAQTTGAATFSSSVTATEFIINNGAADGGQLVLASSGYSNWNIDNYSGLLRAYYGSSVALSISTTGVVTAEQQFRTKIGYQFYADGTAQGGIYPYKVWSGAGTDTTPTFAAEGNLGIYFCVNGQTSKVLTLASTGHLLVGATSTDQTFWPSWDGGVIRIGQGGTIFHYRDSVVDFMIGGNYYISSSGAQETRIGTGGASNIYMENGNIRFRNAVSGAAGSSISWNTSLFLQTNGFVGVSTQTQWNYERFGVGMSQTNTWANVTAIMRLTNYISGGVTKITFTDSSIIDGWFGMVPVGGNSYFTMGFSGYTEQGFRLYQNGTSYFASTMTVNGSILPNSDASYNLGSTSFRWANVYTTDLHLSNQGKQNIVDGTWGDWTLQEGENDIFMLNNRNGEKFKIKLEKV